MEVRVGLRGVVDGSIIIGGLDRLPLLEWIIEFVFRFGFVLGGGGGSGIAVDNEEDVDPDADPDPGA